MVTPVNVDEFDRNFSFRKPKINNNTWNQNVGPDKLIKFAKHIWNV